MSLREYLFRKNLTSKALAEKVQCHPNYIYLIKSKKIVPSMRLAKDISNETGGEVTIEELMAG